MTQGQSTIALEDERWYRALDWHTLFGEGETELATEQMQAWQQWISERDNRRVFDQLVHLLDDGVRYRRRRRPSRDDIDQDPYHPSVSVQEWRREHLVSAVAPTVERSTTRYARRSRSTALIAIAAAVAVAGICFLLSPTTLWRHDAPNAELTYRTVPGEVRTVWLADGSKVALGAQTSLAVHLTRARRAVDLKQGEAWFQVAHDKDRPFVVTAGARTITAVGTAFVVRRDADRVVLTVTEGSVEVADRTRPDSAAPNRGDVAHKTRVQPSRVGRGQQMVYDDKGLAGPVQQADPAAATAWTDGRLQFEGEPLRYVVDRVNRYSRRPIVLDPSTSDLRYTGLVFGDQIDDWICGLEAIYPVEIADLGGQVLVKGRGQRLAEPPFCATSR